MNMVQNGGLHAAFLIVAASALIGCDATPLPDADDAPGDIGHDAALGDDIPAADDSQVVTEGSIAMLIYNVAGLPMEIAEANGTNPIVNMPKIAPLLNPYDLVLVQEDFWYHDDLEAGTTHPYKSDPMWDPPDWDRMGDGLNQFSRTAFSPVMRVAWEVCNGLVDSGSDCLTNKGFTFTRHQLAADVSVDVYNLHMDASGQPEDIAARQAQAVQLADFINANSAGNAVLLGGDTNLKASRPDDGVALDDFLAATGLNDVCRFLECGDERIDRVMFRSSDYIEIVPREWSIPPEFVDSAGAQLSDHLPVFARIGWKLVSH